jgi:hypothetical protein
MAYYVISQVRRTYIQLLHSFKDSNPSPTAVGMFLSRGRGWQSHGSQNQGLTGNWGYKNGDCSHSSSMIKLLVASLLTPSKKIYVITRCKINDARNIKHDKKKYGI